MKPYEHVVEGFENMPKAFIDQMEGKSQGKVIVRVWLLSTKIMSRLADSKTIKQTFIKYPYFLIIPSPCCAEW